MKILNKILPDIFTTITLIGSVATITYFLKDKEISFLLDEKFSGLLIPLITGIFAAILFSIFRRTFLRNLNQKDEFAYNIAIIGFPASGKTTFITSLFGAVMHGKISLNRYTALLKGIATIDRINDNLSKLDKGIPIGSTSDQTLFSYRLNIEEKQSSFLRPRKEYIMEIGDFQGEMTENLVNSKTNIWKHDSDFFNWVKDAHAFVFIVDLGKYYQGKRDYVADISKSIRSAWQKILEMNSKQADRIREKQLLIIFNKADLLIYEKLDNVSIQKLAFANTKEKLPELKYSEIDDVQIQRVKRDFKKLIDFFELESRNFDFQFYSSFLLDKYESRFGLNEIANHIMPRK